MVYCTACAPIVRADKEKQQAEKKAARNRRYDAQRDPKYREFYNSREWRLLSAKYMQDKHYQCEGCGALADHTHHVVPIQTAEGWARRLDYSNLRALCHKCHNIAHDRFISQAKHTRKLPK